MKEDSESSIVVRLSKEAGVENADDLRVYMVSPDGAIVEEAKFENMEARLKASFDSRFKPGRILLREKVRIYVGQAIPKEAGQKDEDTLNTMGAYQVPLSFEKDNSIIITRLPADILIPFPWHFCHVKGNVSKYFNIDGQSVKSPVCHARVHICDVKKIFFWPIYLKPKFKIPDLVLEDLKLKFINLETSLPKFKLQDKEGIRNIRNTGTTKINLPLRALPNRKEIFAKDTLEKKLRYHKLEPLPEQVLADITSESLDVMRRTLVDYHELLFPYICLWPIFWPWFYWKHEEAVVTTDCNGDFDAWLFTFNNTNRNIYIWVEVEINGQWVTVYRPPVPCRTYWDYKCGTDINIFVTDPRVEPCDCGLQGPADAVWFTAIGSSASALRIEQTVGSIALQGATLNNGGCTDILGIDGGMKISPFGANLDFSLFCGRDIFDAGVTHYRWKRTRITDENQVPIPPILQTTEFLDGVITRGYLVRLSAAHYETHYLTLGTGPASAYRIPHEDITEETFDIPGDEFLTPEWSSSTFISASLDSTKVENGIHKFELELLKKVGASFVVVPVDKATFRVSEANNIGNNIPAPDNYLNLAAGNTATSYKMLVRIDNQKCEAQIHDAMLLETGALSGVCGFIIYDDIAQNVQISFEASHPRNFARYSFGVIKGNGTEGTGVGDSGFVISSTTQFNLIGGDYYQDVPVSQLLGSCPGQAAFSENLYVTSLATNGTSRLDGYDDSDVNAFALSNT